MEEPKEIIEEEREKMEEPKEKIEEESKKMEEPKEINEEEREKMEETKEKIEEESKKMEEPKEIIEEEREKVEEPKEKIEEESKKMEEIKIKVGMEEITQAADATYERLPEEEKKEIEKMFKAMDRDRDGKISIDEFKTYFEKRGDTAKVNSNLFNLIDRNCDGNLGLDEVLTLFYIIDSGRPVCDVCRKFIEALFFTCTYCHCSKPAEDGYNVCIACYKSGGFVHEHTEFVDNYTLFTEMKRKNIAGSAGVRQTNSSSSPTGIDQQRNRKRDAFKRRFYSFLQVVPGVASITGTTATLVSGE